MSEAAFTGENRGSFAARALAFTTAFFFCSLTAGALVITLLGSAGRPGVTLNLPALVAAKPARLQLSPRPMRCRRRW